MVLNAIAGSGTRLFVITYILSAFISGFSFLYLGKRWKESIDWKYPLIHFFIVTWSGIMYLNFLNRSIISDFAWYADWLISTPLIVLVLGLTATYNSENYHVDKLAALVGLQFMLIVTGIISQSTGQTAAFWVGNVLMLGVFYLIWGPLRNVAMEAESLGKKYQLLAGYITLFFVAYPTVWYLGLPGPLDVLGDFETSLAFLALPFMCKQIYGFLDLYLIKKAGE